MTLENFRNSYRKTIPPMTLENFRNSYRKTIPPKKTVMPELNSGNVMLPPMQSKPLLPGLPENFMLRQQAEPTDIRNLPNLPSKDGAAFAYPPDEPKLISRKSLDISKPQPFKDLKKGVPIVNKVLFAETYKKKFQTEDHPSLYAFYSQLDPDAKKEYYNILQKQGQESADKFLEAATQELFAKRGDKTAKLANRFSVPGRIALAGAAGLQSGVEGGRSAIKAVRGEKEQSLISAEQIGYQKARGEMGGVEGLASDVTYSIGRMAPSIAANALFPGAGTAVTFLTSGGSAYENALREGKGVNEARVYATMIGTSEAALQKIMGGVAARSGQTVIGKMAGEKITAVIEQLAKTPFMRMALHRLSDMAGEFTEEYLQDILEPVFRNIAFKENNEFKLFTKEALHSGLVGALTSGVMGFASGEDINVYRDAKAINAEYQKAGGDDVWGNISEWAGNKQFGQQAKEVNLPPKRDGAILPTKETVEALGIAQKLGVKAVVKDLPEGISGQYVNGEVIISSKTENPNIPQPEVEVNPQATSETAKAQQYRTRQEAGFANKIAQLLSVPGRASKESLRPIANELAQEFMRTGDISKESADALFEKAYSEGIVINEDFYNQYKGLKEELKTRRIAISDTDKASIPDYNKFRQSNFGTLKIVNDGTPVDTVYQELSGVYPELFPGEIMHPAEQLQHISEVAKSIAKTESDLDSFLGDDSEFFKKSARHEFNNELAGFKAEMSKVKRYNESRANKGQTIRSIEEISKDLAGLGKLKRQAEKVVAKHLLTDRDNAQVDRLLKGEIDFDDIPKNKGYNFEGIKAVYEAKKPAFDIENEFKRYNNQRLEEIHKGVAEDIETLHDWKKKKGEWRYIWRTMRRVVRNVVSDRGAAENIIEKYFDPIDDTEWGKIEFLTEKFNTVHDLELYPEESAAVQLLGEVDSEIDYLTSKKNLSKAETEKLGEIQQQKKVFLENSKDLDMAKVENAIKTFRGLYDDLFSKINEVRVKNGYMPIEYRKNYFPHFTKKQADSALGQALSGIFGNIEVKELPTEIAGKTKDFKPGTVWLPFGQRRKGNMTDYDAVKGFEMYAHLAADAIYHTDNIQRLRALAKGIRYFSSDENLKARIDKINNDADLSFEEKAERVNAIYENEDKSSGSAFVRVLEEYTNLLANKKSKRDRGAEDFFGRTNLYEMARRAESQAAANMVGFNIASAMTNFFPISQTMAATEKQAWLRAAAEAMMNNLENDGFEQQSGFLTRRKGLDPLIKTGLQKATEKAGAVFETVDMTTANFVVRAKYYEQLSKGKTHAEAMKIADTFAAEIMAERSKGAQPTLFGARNPFVKAFTMFQLEPANLLGNLFEDIPYQADGDKKEIAKRLFAYMVASYLFNNLYKKMFGRRMALDPIGLLADNLPDFLDEEISTSRVVMNIGKELAQEIPFLGGVLFDGGRLPITGALPSPKTVYKGIIGLSTGEMNKKKALSSLGKEFSKPGYLLLPPLGGMQAKKTVEGAMALQKGGSYGIDSQGRDVLQFPVDRTAGSVAKTLIGGKSSSKGSQDWVSSGFKSLSAKDTERYKEMIAGGAKPTEAYNIIKDEKSAAARETKEKKAFKERMAKEVPAFRYSDEVEGLIEQYKAKNEGASAPPIRPAERDRTFKTPANKIFSLTDDLLIERQRIYQEIVENAYQKIIGANMSMDKKIALLKAAHTKAKELADLKFFKKHEREVKKHKVILPMP